MAYFGRGETFTPDSLPAFLHRHPGVGVAMVRPVYKCEKTPPFVARLRLTPFPNRIMQQTGLLISTARVHDSAFVRGRCGGKHD